MAANNIDSQQLLLYRFNQAGANLKKRLGSTLQIDRILELISADLQRLSEEQGERLLVSLDQLMVDTLKPS